MQTDSHIEVVSPNHYYAYSRHTEWTSSDGADSSGLGSVVE